MRTLAIVCTLFGLGCAETTRSPREMNDGGGLGGDATSDAAQNIARDTGEMPMPPRGTGRCGSAAGALSILGMMRPAPDGVRCEGSPDDLVLASGVFDVALRDSYEVRPQLAWTGTSRFFYTGFVVELPVGSPDGRLYEVPYSVYQSGSLGALGATRLQVIPPGIGQRLRSEVCLIDNGGVTNACPVPRVRERVMRIILRLSLFAADGSAEGCQGQSNTFNFPIDVCCGCLTAFPNSAELPETTWPGPDCNAPTTERPPCAPGQDDLLDCRHCARSNPAFCQPRGFRSTPSGMACPTDR